MAIGESEPERFDRASLRWLVRYAVEQAHDVEDVRTVAAAFAAICDDPTASLPLSCCGCWTLLRIELVELDDSACQEMPEPVVAISMMRLAR